jgi:CubicO group peptidase (beta-lactamase class C family)
VPNSADRIFRIGSITKQFTSTAILQLVEQGKIDLQTDITKYLTNFSTSGKTVTVEHLLNHTSGIKSYTSLQHIMAKERKGMYMGVDEMLSEIQKQPADFSPGDQFLYNNSGYFLLGAIIEKVSGMTYGEYVTKNLFKPAGMKSSYVDDPKLPNGISTGYQRVNSTEYTIADYVHTSIPYSAGAIFSTVEDLWKWNQAVFSNKLVKKESLEKSFSPTTLNDGSLIGYGYGWSLAKLGNSKVIGHGGGINGFLSYEMYVPDQKIYVCILSNNATVSPDGYAYQVAEMVAGINSGNPVVIAVDESVASEYSAVYKISDREDRVITRKGNQFFSQRTGGTTFEIFPYAKDAFFFKDSPSRLFFKRNNEGKIESVELKGREFIPQVATRTNKPIPSDRQAIELDSTVFDRYAGEYELAPGFTIKIWREEKLFKAQATGQPFFEIFPESETKFFLKVVDAQIEFSKDASGNTTGMTLFQGGREMPGKKIK